MKLCTLFFLIHAAIGSNVVGQTLNVSQEEFFRRVKDTLVYDLGHPDTGGGRKLYCYFNSALSPKDSFSVIGAHYYNEAEYAVIVHDKYTKGHSSFSSEKISSWRDRRWDEAGRRVLESCDTLHIQIPDKSGWFDGLKGFWVPVQKYQGNYYLHNDWACLIAYELTDSTWTSINMEVYPELLLVAKGQKENFILTTNCINRNFLLIDREREIYKVTEAGGNQVFPTYLIPVRRVHDFEIIEYLGTSDDLIVSFVEFDKE